MSTPIVQRDDGELPAGFDSDGSMAVELSFAEWQAELRMSWWTRRNEQPERELWASAREVDRVQSQKSDPKWA